MSRPVGTGQPVLAGPFDHPSNVGSVPAFLGDPAGQIYQCPAGQRIIGFESSVYQGGFNYLQVGYAFIMLTSRRAVWEC